MDGGCCCDVGKLKVSSSFSVADQPQVLNADMLAETAMDTIGIF